MHRPDLLQLLELDIKLEYSQCMSKDLPAEFSEGHKRADLVIKSKSNAIWIEILGKIASIFVNFKNKNYTYMRVYMYAIIMVYIYIYIYMCV